MVKLAQATRQRVVNRLIAQRGPTGNADLARVLGVDRQLLWILTHQTATPERTGDPKSLTARLAYVLGVPVVSLVDDAGRWRD